MMGWPSPDMDIHVGLRSCIIKKKKKKIFMPPGVVTIPMGSTNAKMAKLPTPILG